MAYKKGEKIGKYIITRDFDSTNGGQGQWGFAEYNGEEYFIKKFLNPVYPEVKAPGSEKGKQKKKDRCKEFERKHLGMMKALNSCGDGGLVVKTTDFFKHGNEFGSHYFKVSQKVDTSNLSNEVYNLDWKNRLFIMLTSAGALKMLHRNGIIHLDLKPDNILIQEWQGKLIAKIIDFDSSLIEGDVTPSEELVGDPLYLSPEFAKHIGTYGEELPPTNQSDVFSLGLVFCHYCTGKLPTFSRKYNYPYEALINKGKLELPISSLMKTKEEKLVGKAVFELIKKMLILDQNKRISIDEVHEALKAICKEKLPKNSPRTSPLEKKKKLSEGSGIKIGSDTTNSKKSKEKEDYPKSGRIKFNFPRKS
ncbi:MAG: protein kinase [Trichodesmium sp. ALOHA_ZT_67]|nr:protein kinase [Trichodesmium sp. ALOHA_ZT_67]